MLLNVVRRLPLPFSVLWMGVFCLTCHDTGWARDEKAEPTRERVAMVLLVDALFMRPPVYELLANAEQTIITPAVLTPDGQCVYVDEAGFKALGLTFEEMLPQTVALANQLLKEISPVFERDENQVISFALLESGSPFASSLLLSNQLLSTFRQTLGGRIHVVVPSRSKLFLFPPGEAPLHEERLRLEYRTALYPVSLEVFEISRRGLTAVGTLRP
ncbi:MAG: hypothetical protein SNJ52_01785 [Verrucomicrobiia bacterium]